MLKTAQPIRSIPSSCLKRPALRSLVRAAKPLSRSCDNTARGSAEPPTTSSLNAKSSSLLTSDMICQRCLFRLSSTTRSVARRTYAAAGNQTVASGSYPDITAPRGPVHSGHEGKPTATSTPAAQPHYATPSPTAKKIGPSGEVEYVESPLPVRKSSVAAGTPLKGLGYYKNKEPPMALEDKEYPPWLWTLLDAQKKSKAEGADLSADLFGKSRKARNRATRAALKFARENPDSLLPKIPLEHQTVDLPGGDGTLEGAYKADRAREELTEAMRRARRSKIKERNYLQGM